MNSGEIYNMLDSKMLDYIIDVSLPSIKGKLWVPSFTELVGEIDPSITGYATYDGAQFAFWRGKVSTDRESNNESLKIARLRSGASYQDNTIFWLRSPSLSYNDGFLTVNVNGNPWGTYRAARRYGVVPCFSL